LDGGGDTAIHGVGVMQQGQWHRSIRTMQVQLAALRISITAAYASWQLGICSQSPW